MMSLKVQNCQGWERLSRLTAWFIDEAIVSQGGKAMVQGHRGLGLEANPFVS